MVQVLSNTLDTEILKNINVNRNNVHTQVSKILQQFPVWSDENVNAWLLKAVTFIDLTTLAGDDTRANVTRLCLKAANPLSSEVVEKLNLGDTKVRTAAVCVYPNRVAEAYDVIKRMGLENVIQIASVATGFPSGLYPLSTRLQEIKKAVSDGATEIDVVIDRSLVLMGKWDILYNEVLQMRKHCGDAHLKVILGVGELGSYKNIYKASMVSMLAGAHFIKTSTGKETVNATLPVGLIMCRAIRKFYQMTGIRVGLKPAGGIKTAQDAVCWLVLVYSELGPEWLTPKLFRIGASSLLDVLNDHLNLHTRATCEKNTKSTN